MRNWSRSRKEISLVVARSQGAVTTHASAGGCVLEGAPDLHIALVGRLRAFSAERGRSNVCDCQESKRSGDRGTVGVFEIGLTTPRSAEMMMKSSLLFVCVFASMHSFSSAQDSEDLVVLELPECDIFLFDLDESSGELKISNGRNVTNRPGYDNQPWFTPDSKSLLFTANRKPDRTDVFEYFFESEKTEQVTDTPTQEYSPQVSPDNKTISYVTDGETANQSVWFKSRDDRNESWLMKGQGEREPVGYYSWNHETGYVLFWSRYGFCMRLVHESKTLSHYVSGNAIPSTPHIVPKTDRFSFLHRQGNGEVWIKELNPEDLSIRPLTQAKGSNPNYAWTPSGCILMADDSRLYRCSPDSDLPWGLVADLDGHGMQGVTRLAVSPDGSRLAVVGSPKS